ncbi:fused MFS/spermidine synthase [Niveibacterium sp. SC-1]|uniref:fused MFS/spermidine synthase n=1 Tax=Niveibacterium sp. SC-1 TaxID=3135646 RepID=UPI00311E245A
MPANPIEVSEEAGVRYLHFGSEWIQGAMRVRRPNALELAYTREMAAGLLLREAPWPQRVLLIGLGAGSLTKFFYHHVPQAKITVVEIDPRVPVVAQMHFRLPEEDARLRLVLGDGAEFVMRKTGHWDAILVDGFDHRARAGVLDTEAFYLACRAALRPQGLLAVNLFGQRRGFKASFERIVSAFDSQALAFPSCDSGNVVAFASRDDMQEVSFPELRERAARLKSETGLDLRDTLTRLEQSGHHTGGLLRI